MRFSSNLVRLARVLYEDDEMIGIEIAKHEEKKLEVQPNDKFLSMVFVKNLSDGNVEVWLPWSQTQKGTEQ